MNGGALDLNGLTLKQSVWLNNFFDISNSKTFGNRAASARFAGYNGNPKTLWAVGSENLRKPRIIAEARKRLSTILTSDEVLEKLSKIANTEAVEIKSGDVVRTLELLAKHHKLLTDKVESEVTVSSPQDLPTLYKAEAARRGIVLTDAEASERIAEQLQPAQAEITPTDAVN